METDKIKSLLGRLGLSEELPGYHFLFHAIYLSMQRFRQIPSPLNTLYGQIAAEYSVSLSTVSHDILALFRAFWNTETAERFQTVVGYPAREEMTPKEFIFVLAQYLACAE